MGGHDAPALASPAAEPAPGEFRPELAERTRRSAIPAGVLALVAFLGWAGVDRVLEPARAHQFLLARLAGERS